MAADSCVAAAKVVAVATPCSAPVVAPIVASVPVCGATTTAVVSSCPPVAVKTDIFDLMGILTYIFHEISIATFVLFVMLTCGLWLAYKAQGRPDFDWADMLRDPQGKASSSRLFAFLAIVITS